MYVHQPQATKFLKISIKKSFSKFIHMETSLALTGIINFKLQYKSCVNQLSQSLGSLIEAWLGWKGK